MKILKNVYLFLTFKILNISQFVIKLIFFQLIIYKTKEKIFKRNR